MTFIINGLNFIKYNDKLFRSFSSIIIQPECEDLDEELNKDNKDNKDIKDNKDNKDNKDIKDIKDIKDSKDIKDHKEIKDK